MAARTATPFVTVTLAIAAGVAAILVGCTRHSASDDQQAGASGGGAAYDAATGQTVPASATPGSLRTGDTAAGAQNTTGNAATGVTQPGGMGEGQSHGAPANSSTPQ